MSVANRCCSREGAAVKVQSFDFPEHLLYDIDNQIWYEARGDIVRAGFTPLAISLAGDVLVFTPKRIGKDFETDKSFATIECGKWIGAARAAFPGIVVAHNEALIRRPELLNEDAFGSAWMIEATPSETGWQSRLVTGPDVGPAFDRWLAAEAYRERGS